MARKSDPLFASGVKRRSPAAERTSSTPTKTVDFVRAASLLDAASDGDPALKRALATSHIAIDSFGRILGISADIAEILGFTSARLVGRRLAHRIGGAHRVAFHRALVRLRSTRQPFELSLCVRAKDGTLRPVTLSLASMGSANQVAVVVLRLVLQEPSTVSSAG